MLHRPPLTHSKVKVGKFTARLTVPNLDLPLLRMSNEKEHINSFYVMKPFTSVKRTSIRFATNYLTFPDYLSHADS